MTLRRALIWLCGGLMCLPVPGQAILLTPCAEGFARAVTGVSRIERRAANFADRVEVAKLLLNLTAQPPTYRLTPVEDELARRLEIYDLVNWFRGHPGFLAKYKARAIYHRIHRARLPRGAKAWDRVKLRSAIKDILYSANASVEEDADDVARMLDIDLDDLRAFVRTQTSRVGGTGAFVRELRRKLMMGSFLAIVTGSAAEAFLTPVVPDDTVPPLEANQFEVAISGFHETVVVPPEFPEFGYPMTYHFNWTVVDRQFGFTAAYSGDQTTRIRFNSTPEEMKALRTRMESKVGETLYPWPVMDCVAWVNRNVRATTRIPVPPPGLDRSISLTRAWYQVMQSRGDKRIAGIWVVPIEGADQDFRAHLRLTLERTAARSLELYLLPEMIASQMYDWIPQAGN